MSEPSCSEGADQLKALLLPGIEGQCFPIRGKVETKRDAPADALPLVPEMAKRSLGSLGYQVRFEFTQHGKHSEDHLSSRRCCVNPFAEAHQVGAALLDSLTDHDGVPCRTGKPTEAIDHEGRLVFAGLIQGLLQTWAIIRAAT